MYTYCLHELYWRMHETNRHSTCHIFMKLVSRRTRTSACPFFRGPSCALCKRVWLARALVSSRGIAVWCVGRWTSRGVVVLCGYYCYWDGLSRWILVKAACGCLLLLRSWTSLSACRAEWCFSTFCDAGRVSAPVVLRTVASSFLRSLTSCVLKPSLWTAWISFFVHSS